MLTRTEKWDDSVTPFVIRDQLRTDDLVFKNLRRSRHAERFSYHLQRIDRSLHMREEYVKEGRHGMVLAINYELVSDATRALDSLRRIEELTPADQLTLQEGADYTEVRGQLSGLLKLPALPAWRVTGPSSDPKHATQMEIDELYSQFAELELLEEPAQTALPDDVDYAKAYQRWHPLAEQGHPTAQFNIGLIYENGLGVSVDYSTAARWYQKAAEQGHLRAQFSLGLLFYGGRGVPQSYEAAARWYRLAAEQDDKDAQFNLGAMCDQGLGVPEDSTEAVMWYRRAAEQGNLDAQVNLGAKYDQGTGVDRDEVMAARWWLRAAESGHPHAQSYLGMKYNTGQGVPQDYAKAAAWWRKAAVSGRPSAQFNLGLMYANGQGVRRDLAEARKWLDLAASATALTSAQIAEAQRLVPGWKPDLDVTR